MKEVSQKYCILYDFMYLKLYKRKANQYWQKEHQ